MFKKYLGILGLGATILLVACGDDYEEAYNSPIRIA